ncbi:MAG: enoyl-CoA hydratase/isomerase family protein [Xanthobacteraceae bacterium]
MANVQTSATVEVAIDRPIAVVALNRPEVRNAVNETLRADFIAALARVAGDDAVRGVVLTGNGPAFCAGGDIAAMQQNLNAAQGELGFNGWQRQRRLHEAVGALHRLTKPTIAAVNGPAIGLGCDLALCCDFIIAAEHASFAMSFILRGLVPDGGGLYFLPRRIGLARAKELIFTGRRVDAQEALAMGMIDRVTKPATLVTEARAWAAEVSGGSTVALALAKEILNKTFELADEDVFALGRQAQAVCYTTEEHREAVKAFLAKTQR